MGFLHHLPHTWIPVLCHYESCDCGKILLVPTSVNVFVLRSRLAQGLSSLRCLCRVLPIFRCVGQSPRAPVSETMPSERVLYSVVKVRIDKGSHG